MNGIVTWAQLAEQIAASTARRFYVRVTEVWMNVRKCDVAYLLTLYEERPDLMFMARVSVVSEPRFGLVLYIDPYTVPR